MLMRVNQCILGPVNTISGRSDMAVFIALQGVLSAMCLLHISEKQRSRAQKWPIPQGSAPNEAIQRCSPRGLSIARAQFTLSLFIWIHQTFLLAP
jgi:hypothetical protein